MALPFSKPVNQILFNMLSRQQEARRIGLQSLSRAQSLVFSAESLFLPAIDLLVNKRRPKTIFDDTEFFQFARKSIQNLIEDDLKRIEDGVYPATVIWQGLEPKEQLEGVLKHAGRIPNLFRDGLRAAKARRDLKTKEFENVSADVLGEKPSYYQRNFHFQKDGYLSDESADLYDHQVDVLFGGAADAMRRLILGPIRNHFQSEDGAGLHFLDLAAGTGRATLFLRLMFPKAKITSLDLSSAYLKKSAERLKKYDRHDFVEGAAEDLPFKDQTFDGVFSVFLYHELPLEIRKLALKEQYRVVKPGGFFGFVDSLQLGDVREFDESLKEFPRQYHEPFYRNYIETPMADLIEQSGFVINQSGEGFLSKFVAGQKPQAKDHFSSR